MDYKTMLDYMEGDHQSRHRYPPSPTAQMNHRSISAMITVDGLAFTVVRASIEFISDKTKVLKNMLVQTEISSQCIISQLSSLNFILLKN